MGSYGLPLSAISLLPAHTAAYPKPVDCGLPPHGLRVDMPYEILCVPRLGSNAVIHSG